MAGSARQKIDPQTRDMFDPEIERPDHDKILTTLFADDASLLSLLVELHQSEPLPPFKPDSVFKVSSSGYQQGSIGLNEATERTGVAPSWSSFSAVRIKSKLMEVPMLWHSENGRTSRIMGFCDIGIAYDMVRWPSIWVDEKSRYSWQRNEERHHALIEVKGAWPTVGNLVRQLNLYRYSTPASLTGPRQSILVGPDASLNEIACQHHYRLVTFDSSGSKFTLQDGNRPSISKRPEKGGF